MNEFVIPVASFVGSFGISSVYFNRRTRSIREHRRASGDSEHSGTGTLEAALLAGLTQGTSLGTREDTRVTLAERDEDTPILAHKAANVSWVHGRIMFSGAGVDVEYTNDATAWCAQPDFSALRLSAYAAEKPIPPHGPVPSPNCRCGFYANLTPSREVHAALRLEVELFGRVVVHENGYRASRQRVLRASSPTCWFCGEPAVHAVIRRGYIRDLQGKEPLHFLCADHTRRSDIPIPFGALSRSLEVEIA